MFTKNVLKGLFGASLLAFISMTAAADTFKNYVINDVPVRLPVERLTKAQANLTSLADALKDCTPSVVELSNPLIGRSSTYRLSKSGSSCRVTIDMNSLWAYDCLLRQESLDMLSKGMVGRTAGANVWGDMSEEEKSVLLDPLQCDMEKAD